MTEKGELGIRGANAVITEGEERERRKEDAREREGDASVSSLLAEDERMKDWVRREMPCRRT